MSEGDDTKTKEQLLAEIQALREQLDQQDAKAGKSVPATRRETLIRWVSPVILSLPVATALLKSGAAYAAVTRKPTKTPTQTPTATPTTLAPIQSPTKAGRCIPAPTVSPTLGMGAAPDSGPSSGSRVALGLARALAGGHPRG